MPHAESHRVHRIGWLRATVLGANDGLISTASLVLGVAAAGQGRTAVLTAATAGLVAGAASMALGEYVSVSSQRDSERSDIAKERWELEHQADIELDELTGIYRGKGLDDGLARQVAVALTEHDALAAHLGDELGISEHTVARPVQAATSSAVAFALGAAIPLVAVIFASASARVGVVIAVVIAALAALGALGAGLGGAALLKPTARVVIGGTVAMAVTFAVGRAFGAAVG